MHEQADVHSMIKNISPTVLVIFGATGHLSMHYLIPTLLHMDKEGLLPQDFRLVCVGRREFSAQTFFDLFLKANSELKVTKKARANFLKHLIYYRANFDQPESFKGLHEVIADKELLEGKHACYNRLYYFATAPEYFEPIAKILKREGLLIGCTGHGRTIRILVEKPFGNDTKSAQSLNTLLLTFFKEEQIYRIDHYLGKETVQNLMVMRFANDFLEPIWNAKYIDHIEISALESIGLETRANFYDQTGALKDFVQNHLLHMMALMAINRPKDLTPESIRNEKIKILRALRAFTRKTVGNGVVRGQYAAGNGMKSYVEELGKKSMTETFVAVKAFVNLPRWKNVPFYLRTGKRLPQKVTEISVHFKKHLYGLFSEADRHSNILTFRIQPDERIRLQVNNKIPGFGVNLHGGYLGFGYQKVFKGEIPGAYERLLLDFMEGDQRLFIRSDEIEAAWKFIDSINKNWTVKSNPIFPYASGSAGPKEAEGLIQKDTRAWWTR